MDTLQTALHWQSKNQICLPCYPGSKFLHRGIRIKHYIDNPPSIVDYVRWWNGKNNNICLVPDGNLIVIDFDSLPQYILWIGKYHLDTYTISSRRGKHCYFYVDSIVDVDLNSLPENIEIKYRKPVMIPPSVVDGFEYRIEKDVEIMRVEKITDVIECSPQSKKEKVLPVNVTINGSHNNVTINNNRFFSYSVKNTNIFTKARQAISLTSYLSDYEPKSSDNTGRFYMAKCPAHNDNHHSLSIDTHNQLAKCFKPSCKLGSRGFDVVGIHSILTGLSQGQAAKALLESVGL